MSDERPDEAGGEPDHDDGGDDLCDLHISLDEHEITGDADLPAATGGVEQSAD